jgi:hypothetical protein
VAHGHRPHEVWGYSLRVIQVYVDLITVRVRQQLHALTVAVRHTQGSDAKVFREFLKSLEGDE